MPSQTLALLSPNQHGAEFGAGGIGQAFAREQLSAREKGNPDWADQDRFYRQRWCDPRDQEDAERGKSTCLAGEILHLVFEAIGHRKPARRDRLSQIEKTHRD